MSNDKTVNHLNKDLEWIKIKIFVDCTSVEKDTIVTFKVVSFDNKDAGHQQQQLTFFISKIK